MTSLYRQKRLEDFTYWRSSAETASSTNVDVSTVDISLSRIVCQARSQGGRDRSGPTNPPQALKGHFSADYSSANIFNVVRL